MSTNKTADAPMMPPAAVENNYIREKTGSISAETHDPPPLREHEFLYGGALSYDAQSINSADISIAGQGTYRTILYIGDRLQEDLAPAVKYTAASLVRATIAATNNPSAAVGGALVVTLVILGAKGMVKGIDSVAAKWEERRAKSSLRLNEPANGLSCSAEDGPALACEKRRARSRLRRALEYVANREYPLAAPSEFGEGLSLTTVDVPMMLAVHAAVSTPAVLIVLAVYGSKRFLKWIDDRKAASKRGNEPQTMKMKIQDLLQTLATARKQTAAPVSGVDLDLKEFASEEELLAALEAAGAIEVPRSALECSLPPPTVDVNIGLDAFEEELLAALEGCGHPRGGT